MARDMQRFYAQSLIISREWTRENFGTEERLKNFSPRVGLCSSYIRKLEVGDEVELSISRGTFNLVRNAEYIMIGPGTGLAPFRSIYQNG
jgi:sulfite reductase alpha subunit-like flavoprotein